MLAKPISLLDFILWPILKVIWEPLSIKGSHWWHWKDLPIDKKGGVLVSPKILKISGILGEKKANTFWTNFWQRNFGWKNIVLLNVYAANNDGLAKNYRLGFVTKDKFQLCSVILSRGTGVILGPEDVYFFAVDLNCNLLRVEANYQMTKKLYRKAKIKKTYPKII